MYHGFSCSAKCDSQTEEARFWNVRRANTVEGCFVIGLFRVCAKFQSVLLKTVYTVHKILNYSTVKKNIECIQSCTIQQ